MDPIDDQVAAVRAFNRFYTPMIGLLSEHLVESPYNLTEARVLFELAARGELEVVSLRAELGVDPGYLSRIVTRFEGLGLVARARSTVDGRRQVLKMTDAGWTEFYALDASMAAKIRELIEGISDEGREHLLEAMETITRELGGRLVSPRPARPRALTLRDLRPGEIGWVIARHGALYHKEYGWNSEFERLVARIVTDFAQRADPRERAWIADRGGEPVGCVFCARRDDETAQLRCLLVEPSVRGLGLGRLLVDEVVSFAREQGYGALVLWTNSVLLDARRLYERAGFRLVEEKPLHAFGHDLVEQTFRLGLR